MTYYAHKSEDGRFQTVEEHLRGTAEYAANFAAAFGAAEYGYLVGTAHDIGKQSDEFQHRLNGGAKVDHATAGAIECVNVNEIHAALAVLGHHGGLADTGNIRTDLPGTPSAYGRIKKGMQRGIPNYKWDGTLVSPTINRFDNVDKLTQSFWTRMLFSCLVDADYMDTERFMTGARSMEHYDSLPKLLRKLIDYVAPWWNPQSELNSYRCEILRTCFEKGQQSKGLYSLTVPTGGGKTISSLAFALSHAVHNKMDRVIYVIPYTSIIDQNAAVFRGILGDSNVIEHHSNVVYDDENETNLEYCRKRWATENWDAPVVVTTAVQFFESLYSNRPSSCRKLHNIANSVVIFDEAQMIPLLHLRPCVAAIAKIVSDFGASAVLCTATQPVLNDLLSEYAPNNPVEELCPRTTELYEKFRRVTYKDAGKISNEELNGLLRSHEQVLCIVNSRKQAQAIFEKLPSDGSFHLSTLMIPAHRQAVLAEIRNRLADGSSCRVVSTSLIEAGVDVDFPVVYREKAGLDSILQAAGRCNREGRRNLENSMVVIYEGETLPPMIFRTNIGATCETMAVHQDVGSPAAVKHYFTCLRSLVGDEIDQNNIVSALQKGIAGCELPFETVAKRFNLIDSNTKTIYVPMEEVMDILERIKSGVASRQDYRKAGRYSVSVYPDHYARLCSAGVLHELDESAAILLDLSVYDENMGLSLDVESGQALFI